MVIGWSQDPTARPTAAQWLKTLHEIIEPDPEFIKEQDLLKQGSQANVCKRRSGIVQRITSLIL
jgi:hypothetical protein